MPTDHLDAEVRSLMPPTHFSRRGFLTTTLIARFTVATGPVNAQSVITTDASGLTAGEVKVPVPDGQLPAYRAMPATGGPFPTVLVVQEIFGVHEHIKDVLYDGVPLGFHADYRPSYREKEAKDGWQRLQGWLQKDGAA